MFKGKIAHSMFLECQKIAEKKNNWQSDLLKRTFIAGMLMSEAGLNMSVSYAPKILIRMLELIGVNGDRQLGVHLMHQSAQFKNTIIYPATAFCLVTYYSAHEQYLALGEPDDAIVLGFHEYFSKLCPPNGLVYLIGNAFKAQREGNFDKALKVYMRREMRVKTNQLKCAFSIRCIQISSMFKPNTKSFTI